MSFSSQAKLELCAREEGPACRRAECYGIFLFARSFSASSVALITENGAAARLAAQLAAETAGCVAEVSSSVCRRREGAVYAVSVEGEDGCARLLHAFGHSGREVSLRIRPENLAGDACRAAFLRGAFLACGTATDPRKDYHLEFLVPYRNLAQDLMRELSAPGMLQPALVMRKGSYVVYLKESEQIADLFTYLGAPNAAMELMQVKMVKELRNNVNRKRNFETANLDKTASAAARQILAIRRIAESCGLDALPDDLREMARLRMENPELSLRELGERLSRPISRSGVNHRLERLIEWARHETGEGG